MLSNGTTTNSLLKNIRQLHLLGCFFPQTVVLVQLDTHIIGEKFVIVNVFLIKISIQDS